ncbi:MAG: hypothetical protein HFF45_10070 [Lawsonibacter sp.]|jgi:hypothetical protein|nr:hypothetical protein [Lawsonibacter sp.]MCI9295540.1 hypothetical protein [Lawsonibacter sp.]MCI9656350.1 hypothetical protein [Lawsonibacter sp.]
MAVVIDFSSLTGELHKVSETLVDQEAREELNPYLLNVILPMLMRGEYPRLKDIDFEQFEQYDPPELVDYVETSARRTYELIGINHSLCGLAPSCVKTQAFL